MLPFVNQTLAAGVAGSWGIPRSDLLSLSTSSTTYEIYGVNDTLLQSPLLKIGKKIGGLKARHINELEVWGKFIRFWGPNLADYAPVQNAAISSACC
jgi:hypothetical protein